MRNLCDTTLGLRHRKQTIPCKLLPLGSGVPAKCAVLGAMAAAHVPVRCPVSGVTYKEFANSDYERRRLCVALRPGFLLFWVWERGNVIGDVWQVGDGSRLALRKLY